MSWVSDLLVGLVGTVAATGPPADARLASGAGTLAKWLRTRPDAGIGRPLEAGPHRREVWGLAYVPLAPARPMVASARTGGPYKTQPRRKPAPQDMCIVT